MDAARTPQTLVGGHQASRRRWRTSICAQGPLPYRDAAARGRRDVHYRRVLRGVATHNGWCRIWEHREDQETLVTVEFRYLTERQTEVVLQHEWFGGDEVVHMHNEGWDVCFFRLGELLEQAEYQIVLG